MSITGSSSIRRLRDCPVVSAIRTLASIDKPLRSQASMSAAASGSGWPLRPGSGDGDGRPRGVGNPLRASCVGGEVASACLWRTFP